MAAIPKFDTMTLIIPSLTPEDGADGAGRATGAPSSGARPPDPEVVPVAKRRQFSAAEKRRILEAADRCAEPGDLGRLMRREGIYSSMLSTWRKKRAQADEAALAPKARGPKPDAPARQLAHWKRDRARLERKLARAEAIIDAQKKLCDALGLTVELPKDAEDRR